MRSGRPAGLPLRFSWSAADLLPADAALKRHAALCYTTKYQPGAARSWAAAGGRGTETYRIAICDDEPEQEQTLKAVVDAWGKENRVRCAVAVTAA